MIAAKWEEVKCDGSLPGGIFGHTTTLIGKTKVVLFGGVVESQGKLSMVNSLYVYSVYNSKWTLVECIPS